MRLERQRYLRADQRRDYANGYKPKTVATRLGKITFSVPQVREGGFYPNALEIKFRL
jgi:putative transposase